MPDVHLPRLEDEEEPSRPDAHAAHPREPPSRAMQRSTSLLKIGLDVLLISTGVFLGLMGEQWRERAHHRELAEASLRRFRTEISRS